MKGLSFVHYFSMLNIKDKAFLILLIYSWHYRILIKKNKKF